MQANRTMDLRLKTIPAFVIPLALLFTPFLLSAETGRVGLAVYPQKFELDLSPGEVYQGIIKLGNRSELALPISARIVNFGAEEDTGEMIFKDTTSLTESSNLWFSFQNPDVILEPGETREIKFTITVPSEAEFGGFYSFLMFEPRMPDFYFAEGKPRAIPIIGIPFLIAVQSFSFDDEREKIKVVEFAVNPADRLTALENLFSFGRQSSLATAGSLMQIPDKRPSSFILRVKNTDMYHLRPYGTVGIYNIFGRKVYEGNVPEMTILPGMTRSFAVEFEEEMPALFAWLPQPLSKFLFENVFLGKYEARLELEARTPMRAEAISATRFALSLFAFPWTFWLPIMAFLAFLSFLFLKNRARFKDAFRVLFAKQKHV
jgi:hypothetical protein